MNVSREQAIANAKLVLKQAGYFVDNLWHIDDVKQTYNCDDDNQAQSILNDALTNDGTINRIWFSIDMVAQYEGLTLKD
jgi:hypothetical protein